MASKKGSKKNQVTIKIDGSMSIYDVAGIHKKILTSFTENTTVNIDLSEVNSCDVAGIQLLLSAIKTGKESGNRIILSDISETIQQTARLVGVQQDMLCGSNGG